VQDTLGLPGPAVAADQLPDSHPFKEVALDFIEMYEAKFGAGTYNQFAANIWGAKLLLEKAIPIALKSAKPGTREFRLAIKQALDTMGEVVVPQGVLRYTPTDHLGYDDRARFMLLAQGRLASCEVAVLDYRHQPVDEYCLVELGSMGVGTACLCTPRLTDPPTLHSARDLPPSRLSGQHLRPGSRPD